jgi:Ca2+-binding RTX toxin-like protein
MQTTATVRRIAAIAIVAAPILVGVQPAYAAAGAASVSSSGVLTYEAAGSVRNVIRVTSVAGAYLVDDIVPVGVGAGCQRHTADQTIVRCTGSVSGLRILGNGGDDEVIVGITTPWTTVYGGAGADTLWGGVGVDYLYGGAGDDTIDGGAGADNLYGDSGLDDIYGDTGDDLVSGGPDGDWLEGQEGMDLITGADGDDDLYGGANDDDLIGGAGWDYLDGGPDDTSLGDDCNEGEDLISCES